MTEERWEVARISVSLEAKWKGISGHYTARISNFSTVGAYFESVGKAHPRETISFEVEMPSGEWIALQGEVVYRTDEGDFGVYFTDVDAEIRTQVLQLVEHHRMADGAPDGAESSYQKGNKR